MEWREQTPKFGDTVKIEFADFTNLGSEIGVVIREPGINYYIVIDTGNRLVYVTSNATLFVWV
jgi:hypothetical protein